MTQALLDPEELAALRLAMGAGPLPPADGGAPALALIGDGRAASAARPVARQLAAEGARAAAAGVGQLRALPGRGRRARRGGGDGGGAARRAGGGAAARGARRAARRGAAA